jgi:hypothetical protein
MRSHWKVLNRGVKWFDVRRSLDLLCGKRFVGRGQNKRRKIN